jgi:hypothetical protein
VITIKKSLAIFLLLQAVGCGTAVTRPNLDTQSLSIPSHWSPISSVPQDKKCIDITGEFDVNGERVDEKGDGVRQTSLVKSYGMAWWHPRKVMASEVNTADFETSFVAGTERLSIKKVSENSFGIVSGTAKSGYRMLIFDSSKGDYLCDGAFIDVSPQTSTFHGEGWGGADRVTSTSFARGVDGSLYVFRASSQKATYFLFSTSPTTMTTVYRFKRADR